MTALSSRAPLDNDDVEPLGLSLLELEEEETTDHVIGDLTITLRGYPRSSGQTLQCTGETTWRGGDLLARHLHQSRAATASVVEVGSGLGLVSLARFESHYPYLKQISYRLRRSPDFRSWQHAQSPAGYALGNHH